jgi:hypothetical protein
MSSSLYRTGPVCSVRPISTATIRGGDGFGTAIHSMTSGSVYDVKIWGDASRQNWVTILTGDGEYITYMHITAALKKGDLLFMGDKIGVTDNSGSVGSNGQPITNFGPHVHIFGTTDG